MRQPLPTLLVALAAGSLVGNAAVGPQAARPTVVEHHRTVRVDGLDRTALIVVPPSAGVRPAVVVVLHGGSGGSGARIRGFIGRELEQLAERHGFLIAYPDGIDGSWNDCRAGATYGAKLRNVGDVAFVEALGGRLADEFGTDQRRVYTMGYSNGAHLAFRMALEAPGVLAGVAAFAANLPAADSLDCAESPRPMPVLLVNGTDDPINPFEGGEVALPDGTRLGRVRSAVETLLYFGRLAGHVGDPEALPVFGSDSAAVPGVEARGWTRAGAPQVALYAVRGGGHTIPSPLARFPEFLGRAERRFSAAAAAVRLFGLANRAPAPSVRGSF